MTALLLAALAAALPPLAAQDGMPLMTLAAFEKSPHSALAQLADVDVAVDAAPAGFSFEGEYLGETRALSAFHRAAMDLWVQSVPSARGFTAHYTSEIKVKAGDRVFWLPFQKGLLADLAAYKGKTKRFSFGCRNPIAFKVSAADPRVQALRKSIPKDAMKRGSFSLYLPVAFSPAGQGPR